MRSMQEFWKDFRDSVYPEGVPATQNKECHQAFFAGALSVLCLYDQIAELDDDKAIVEYQKLRNEVFEVCEARKRTLEARN